MKKAATLLLLLILFISQVGFYFIYTIQQYRAKEEMEKSLLASIPESSLETIETERYADQIIWLEEGKEFSLEGVMYDVAFIKKVNGKTMLYCINDKKEKELLDNLANAINRNQSNNKQDAVKIMLTDVVNNYAEDLPLFIPVSSNYTSFDSDIFTSFKEISSPPPRI